uniref:GRAM domain-containing protein 2B-like n=1 Tax=Salarias fasciatus TaxID=181472 RepID=A0A672I5N5_SALFA
MNVKHRRKLSLDSSMLSDGGGLLGVRKSSSLFNGRKTRVSQSLDDAHIEIQELKHSLNSSMPLREQPIAEGSLCQSNGPIRNHSFQKHNKSFHKLFSEIPEDEKLTHTFTCALQKEVLYHGRLFVSENHVCFHSSVLLKDTKVVIPHSSVREVTGHSSALSMLSIQTADGEKYSFVSLRGRQMCYKLLQRLCSHAQSWSPNSSPHVSSAENEADQMSSSSSIEDHDSSSGVIHISSEGSIGRNSTDQNSLTHEDHKGVSSWMWSFTERIKPSIIFSETDNLSIIFYVYLFLYQET